MVVKENPIEKKSVNEGDRIKFSNLVIINLSLVIVKGKTRVRSSQLHLTFISTNVYWKSTERFDEISL